jgi:2-polyprenyl-3-methyl-5-hydroxy-6-metoxy-1,4-benzoquinol methylase
MIRGDFGFNRFGHELYLREFTMLGLRTRTYPYMEEVNEGIVRQFQQLSTKPGRVLDVGCGRGQLGEAIRKFGWEVCGIEQSTEACDAARSRLDRLIQADLNQFEHVRDELGHDQFDALIFSDVLEHVYDPEEVLATYLEFVKPGGLVLISVPNMVVWTNRFMLMLGQVRYTDTGVMDRTHIRFFTFNTAKA